jgi:hypothetical protein
VSGDSHSPPASERNREDPVPPTMETCETKGRRSFGEAQATRLGVENAQHILRCGESYEDFVQGYRPDKEGFVLRNGLFHQFKAHLQAEGTSDALINETLQALNQHDCKQIDELS